MSMERQATTSMEMSQAMTEPPSAADMHPRDAAQLGRRTYGSQPRRTQKNRGSSASAGAARRTTIMGNFNLWDDDEVEQEKLYPSPRKTMKLVHSTHSREDLTDEDNHIQYFESLLKELLDGQRRLERQLGDFSSLQPLVEEVKHDVQEMNKKLRCEPQRAPISDVVASIEVPPPPLTDRQSLVSAEQDELIKDFNVSECEDYGSKPAQKAPLSNSCPGYSIKDVPDFPGKATIHINVGGAELEQESKDESVTSLCIVKLGERKVLETSAICGLCPQWKHEESLPYLDEDTLEFSVEVLGKSGSPSRLGTSSLQLDDCRSPGGFSGLLQLTQRAGQHVEDKTEASVLGQLEVSVRLEYRNECVKHKGSLHHLSSMDSRLSLLQQTTMPTNQANRLRHSMLAVNGTSLLSSSSTGSCNAIATPRSSRVPLKSQWPTSIAIREGLTVRDASFEEQQSGDGRQALNALQSGWNATFGASSSQLRRGPTDGGMSQTFGPERCQFHIILDPASKKILVYDLLSSIVLLHDFVVIPYMLAWEVPLEGWFKQAAWLSCIFWMFDILMSFITGYVSDGQVQLRWWRVAKHYLRTWFALDISLVLLDFICVFGSEVLVGKVTRIFRILRFVRVISLIRALRVTIALEHVLDHRTSELSASMSYILKVFVVILWLGHVICCTWYWIGMHGSSVTGLRWFDSIDNADAIFSDLPTDYQYWTSFHWALSQISGNGVELISPMNTAERIFNIACLVFGVLFGSALVSSLSATMIEVQMFKQEKLVKIRTVRQFLGQNDIPSKLAYRVQKQLKERIGKQKRISTMDVPELSLLSHKLRVELQFAIIGPHLVQHPLYNLCVDIDTHAVQSFCYETVEVIQTPPGEVIFAHSNDADHAFFIIRGELQYIQNPISASHLQTQTCTNVGAGAWLSTAALWSCWKHVGNMEACGGAELLTLNAKGMLSTMLQHPVLSTIFREYGRQFHNRLTKAMPPYADWPSDLEVPFTSYAELVLAMSNELRVIVSMSALSKLRRERVFLATWQKHGLAMLEEEVRSGKSTVMITETGVVERVVAVAVLHLQCSDGRVLVQVGRCVGGVIVACCRLPGKHQNESEMPGEAVQRLIDTDLEPLKPGIQWDTSRCAEQADESKESPTYGICTHYVKTAHFGLMDTSFPLMPEGSRLNPKSDMPPHGERDMEKNFMSNSHDSEPSRHHVSWDASAVFAVTSGQHTGIYAWLSFDEFDAHHADLVAIQTWLDDYEVPESVLNAGTMRKSNPFKKELSTATVHPYAVLPSSCSEATINE